MMRPKPIWWPNRRSARLRGHDYHGSHAYFVTLCAYRKRCLFGKVVEKEIQLTDLGVLVKTEWEKTGQIRPNIWIDSYIVMPVVSGSGQWQ